MVSLFTRYNIYIVSYDNSPYFLTSFIFIFITLFWYIFFLFLKLYKNFGIDSYLYKLGEDINKLNLARYIEFILVIFGTLLNGFILYARVSNGQCDSSVSIWKSQTCNPVASSESIPPDQVILLLITPLTAQLLVQGVTIQTITLCWFLGVLFILASMIKVGGWFDGWTLLYTAYFLNIAVMSEKSHRLIFLEGKRVAVVEMKRRELLEELFEVGICVYMFMLEQGLDYYDNEMHSNPDPYLSGSYI
jgi:hypothetical protein